MRSALCVDRMIAQCSRMRSGQGLQPRTAVARSAALDASGSRGPTVEQLPVRLFRDNYRTNARFARLGSRLRGLRPGYHTCVGIVSIEAVRSKSRQLRAPATKC